MFDNRRVMKKWEESRKRVEQDGGKSQEKRGGTDRKTQNSDKFTKQVFFETVVVHRGENVDNVDNFGDNRKIKGKCRRCLGMIFGDNVDNYAERGICIRKKRRRFVHPA